MSHKDPVTHEVREAVLRRDQGCVAQLLGYVHVCRDHRGNVHGPHELRKMELDHVGEGRMGKRSASTPAHLATLCHSAHQGGWATSHRPALREYLERVNHEGP